MQQLRDPYWAIWRRLLLTECNNTTLQLKEKYLGISCNGPDLLINQNYSEENFVSLNRTQRLIPGVLGTFVPSQSQVVNIDPQTSIRLLTITQTGSKFMAAPFDAILAHEMGHAVLGLLDNGANNMRNVRRVENPYRMSRGYSLRGAY